MNSVVGWMELSPDALRELRRSLEQKPEGVVDEMGVLAIHTGYADRFFPGTSVLHQRPRYAFFTCWNYLSLSKAEGNSALARKECAELWVRNQLLAAGESGVIGTVNPTPVQPVDFVYWTALKKWGFYRGPTRSKFLSRWPAITPVLVNKPLGKDEDAREEPGAAFSVPKPPHHWLQKRPRVPTTFDLTGSEARFLQQRLEALSPHLLSPAARIAGSRRAKADLPWNDSVIVEAAREGNEVRQLHRARQASHMAFAIRAIYGALVEVRRNRTITAKERKDVEDDAFYRRTLIEVLWESDASRQEIRGLVVAELQKDIAVPRPLEGLLNAVKDRIDQVRKVSDLDRLLLSEDMLTLFTKTEERRKGRLARLPTLHVDRRKNLDENPINVSPIDYRWRVVRQLLSDLHDGLRAER